MSILDTLTGGSNKTGSDALKRAEAAFANIQTPTISQLTLPELQQYVQDGILTPAEAQTMLQQGNAYNDINLDPSSMENEQDAVNKLKAVGDAKGMTPQMQAQLTQALDQVATNTHGANAGIADQFAQKGIPSSLMAEAAMREEAGSDARNANLTATQAAGTAEQNAINAMMNEGNLASTMHGQQYSEASDKAAAENAMRQWNAGATNATNEANAGREMTANQYNTGTKQNVSDSNTGLSNQRTEYNANLPETVFNNQITKASGLAGVNQAQANQATSAGNQMMGLIGAGVGAAGNAFAPGAGSAATTKKNPNQMAEGGEVPGDPTVPGDSPANDKVHALLSPGEVVIPRSIVNDPEAVKRFVQHLAYGGKVQKPVHPDDVHLVLEALTNRRVA